MLKARNYIPNFFSVTTNFRLRRVFFIALAWTLLDAFLFLLNTTPLNERALRELVTRIIVIFILSLPIGYLFVFSFHKIFKKQPAWLSFIIKALLLAVAAIVMSIIAQFINFFFINNSPLQNSFWDFYQNNFYWFWGIRTIVLWMGVFLVTQLFLEITDKYASGVFLELLAGKYKNPFTEKRIIMFMDLKDSTPIAEKLGHEEYFLFIRDFIHHISNALISHGGVIYQYVGDEIVVSWPYGPKYAKKALASIIEARRNIQKASEYFRRDYDEIPEFRVGIHAGEVTIGEIGVIKKDLAMSGDTMNTTARIRSACTELNQKFIVSADFVEISDLKDWQRTSLGEVELKGKADNIELFSLKI